MKKNKSSPGDPSPQPSKRVKFNENPRGQSRDLSKSARNDDVMNDEDEADDYDEELLDAEGLSHGSKKRRTVKDVDDDSDEEKADSASQAKKKPEKHSGKTMSQRDIQGQEKTGAEYEEGQKLEPFNMDEEFEEGDFDETGFYTLKKSAVDSHDPWLDSLTDSDIQKAKDAQEKRLAKEAADLESKPKGKIRLMKEVIAILEADETPLQALRRLAAATKKYGQQKKNQPAAPVLTPEQEKQRKEKFDRLTDASFQLMEQGITEINTMPRKELLDLISSEIQAKRKGENPDEEDEEDEPAPATATVTFETEQVEEPSASVSAGVQWRYKWEGGAEVFGPFSSEQMNAWADQGYFGAGVLVCKEGTEEYVSSKRVDFTLYIDD